MVMEIAAKFFLSISTAEAIVNAINNGMGIMTIIALAGATYGWGAVAYPLIRGAVAKWGFRQAVNW
ncbi:MULTISPECIES: hypothetical protein [Bacillus]|uniref:Uncharacterized protein n=1 Tax=Bacillus thuringiensis TaxID=1428 RepID=A0A4R4B2R3_BACTU|nr:MULTISPECIES: hypothetical protein [Bacillus]PGE66833.1 hypothetical protein COM69_18240 [Bacillus toyonensis]PHD47151.1 hypothetical protein COF65_00160 [Bacillus toyonensis]TCW47605.1 hypothetical protein EC917_12477 [Bacillus thuringiensis]TCW47761.1 hypothetical protein EC910_12377 [Bacillus thuringiensis]